MKVSKKKVYEALCTLRDFVDGDGATSGECLLEAGLSRWQCAMWLAYLTFKEDARETAMEAANDALTRLREAGGDHGARIDPLADLHEALAHSPDDECEQSIDLHMDDHSHDHMEAAWGMGKEYDPNYKRPILGRSDVEVYLTMKQVPKKDWPRFKGWRK